MHLLKRLSSPPQELHRRTVMSKLHPLPAVQSEPAHQVGTCFSSQRPGGGNPGGHVPVSAAATVSGGSPAAGRRPLTRRQPQQLRQLVRGQRSRGAPRRLPLAHGTAEIRSGRAAEPVRQTHASVRELGLVIARGELFTLVLYLFLQRVSATISIKTRYVQDKRGGGACL